MVRLRYYDTLDEYLSSDYTLAYCEDRQVSCKALIDLYWEQLKNSHIPEDELLTDADSTYILSLGGYRLVAPHIYLDIVKRSKKHIDRLDIGTKYLLILVNRSAFGLYTPFFYHFLSESVINKISHDLYISFFHYCFNGSFKDLGFSFYLDNIDIIYDQHLHTLQSFVDSKGIIHRGGYINGLRPVWFIKDTEVLYDAICEAAHDSSFIGTTEYTTIPIGELSYPYNEYKFAHTFINSFLVCKDLTLINTVRIYKDICLDFKRYASTLTVLRKAGTNCLTIYGEELNEYIEITPILSSILTKISSGLYDEILVLQFRGRATLEVKDFLHYAYYYKKEDGSMLQILSPWLAVRQFDKLKNQ